MQFYNYNFHEKICNIKIKTYQKKQQSNSCSKFKLWETSISQNK